MWRNLFLLCLLSAVWQPVVGGCSQCPKAFDTANTKQQAQEIFACPKRILEEEGPESLKPLFIEWQLRFKIEYLPAVAEKRYSIWENNVRRMIQVNFDNGRADWQGFTPLTGLTSQEAKRKLLWRKPAPIAPGPDPDAPLVPNDSLPDVVDWEAQGLLTPVKNQGNCGSCWAFTGIAAIEAKLKMQTGTEYNLSEQQVIDCNPTAWACWGGWLDAVFSFASKNPLVSEKTYPYTLSECIDPPESNSACFTNRCPTDSCKSCRLTAPNEQLVKLNSTGFVRTPTGARDNLMLAVAQNGPTAVAMKVEDDFFQYTGGIYTKPEGSCGPTDSVDHAVLIVGYDKRKPNPYWKIRNTWGPDWGERGYFRMSMEGGSVGPCQIYVYGGYYPTTPILSGPSPTVSSPPPPPPSTPQPQPPPGTATGNPPQPPPSPLLSPAPVSLPPSLNPAPASPTLPPPSQVTPSPSPPPPPPPSPSPPNGVSVLTAPLRLVRGKVDSTKVPTLMEGQLQVQYQNQWGFVCTNGFTQASANVACRQLKKGSLGFAAAPSVYGPAKAAVPNWMNNVNCKGTETLLQDCPFSGFGVSPCSQSQAVGVKCGYYQLRMVYVKGTPATSRNYRVEALFNRKWGTLCSATFTATDAGVLCRSAGLGSSGSLVTLSTSSKPKQGSAKQPIWMDGPGCTGSEQALPLCKQKTLIGQQSCGTNHSKDVGVRCSGKPPSPAPKNLRPVLKAVAA